MGLFGKKKKSFSAGLYGKHPDADDFLRVNAAGKELRALDDWLSGALSIAERLVPSWESFYAAAPPFSIIFEPGEPAEACLIAALAPSTDRIGRRFPLVLFAELDLALLVQSYPQVPYLSFWSQTKLLHDRTQTMGRSQLLQAAEGLSAPEPGHFSQASRQQQAELQRITLGDAFASAAGWVAQAREKLRQVCLDVAPGKPLPRYGLRIPLWGRQRSVQVTFWLTLLQQLCPIRLVPTALWSDERLLIYLSAPSDKALAGLWLEQWQDDTVFDVVPPGQLPPAFTLDPDQPLSALLASGT